MINWKLFQITVLYLDNRTEQWQKIALYLWFFQETFKWMKLRFSVRSNSKKIVLEKGSLKILHLESASKSSTFFTHVKVTFSPPEILHKQFYWYQNLFHDYFFLLFNWAYNHFYSLGEEEEGMCMVTTRLLLSKASG